MALFGLFGKKDPVLEAKRLQKAATQKFGPAENRQKALEELRDLNFPDGWAALLQRFTFRVEPGITDDEEKAFVCQVIVDAGAPAVPVIKQFVLKHEQVAWPLKALSQIVPEAELVETILLALEKEGPDYTRDSEKKLTLIRSLEDHDDERISLRLIPFFEDPSEDVRSASMSAATRRPVEAVREPLVKALERALAEKSERLRIAAAEAFARTGYAFVAHKAVLDRGLPAGFALDKDGVVKAK